MWALDGENVVVFEAKIIENPSRKPSKTQVENHRNFEVNNQLIF